MCQYWLSAAFSSATQIKASNLLLSHAQCYYFPLRKHLVPALVPNNEPSVLNYGFKLCQQKHNEQQTNCFTPLLGINCLNGSLKSLSPLASSSILHSRLINGGPVSLNVPRVMINNAWYPGGVQMWSWQRRRLNRPFAHEPSPVCSAVRSLEHVWSPAAVWSNTSAEREREAE